MWDIVYEYLGFWEVSRQWVQKQLFEQQNT
jgi:hypothetical protein